MCVLQTEMCSTGLVDILQSVVNGSDGCLFCYGHARLGKISKTCIAVYIYMLSYVLPITCTAICVSVCFSPPADLVSSCEVCNSMTAMFMQNQCNSAISSSKLFVESTVSSPRECGGVAGGGGGWGSGAVSGGIFGCSTHVIANCRDGFS